MTTEGIIKASSAQDARVEALSRRNEALERKLEAEIAKREALEANGCKINMEIAGIPSEEGEDPKPLSRKL